MRLSDLHKLGYEVTLFSMSQRAPFIVIEGLDRSGKTTQTYKLHETLKNIGVEAKSIKFPGKHLSVIKENLFDPSLSGCFRYLEATKF
jgi:thymidylate kinase